jgi:5-methylcytosine-specific restriction protein B
MTTAALEQIGAFYRPWVLALMRVLAEHGAGKPADMERRVLELAEPTLSTAQLARVRKNNYIRWGAHNARKLGWLGRQDGVWELTALGTSVVGTESGVPLLFPANIKPIDEPANDAATDERETVTVTDYSGYELPVLRSLAQSPGPKKKAKLVASVYEQVRDKLSPGDERMMPQGRPVWEYRTSWTLSNLKKLGEIANPGSGLWEITATGTERLSNHKGAAISLVEFQNSKASVLKAMNPTHSVAAPPPSPLAWDVQPWNELEGRLGPDLFNALQSRIRPDLLPTPTDDRRPLPRNVIFYGPPGTGKTHVAKEIARALTSENEPSSDGHWQLVQFHPSYSYEDFIQGMRPDLSKAQLRYELREGPFVRICRAADKDPDAFYVLVIDEINRGDPARIFGELLYALEYRHEPVQLALEGELTVPPNLVILGTMNSVDRSVAIVDYALRRRFGFLRLDPDGEIIEEERSGDEYALRASYVLSFFNRWLSSKLSREHAIGHSFFLSSSVDLTTIKAFDQAWTNDIHPLLEEYFFGDANSLSEARKVWLEAVSKPIP